MASEPHYQPLSAPALEQLRREAQKFSTIPAKTVLRLLASYDEKVAQLEQALRELRSASPTTPMASGEAPVTAGVRRR